jgi:energy-coupling factor transporter transmembrane protein EcfT
MRTNAGSPAASRAGSGRLLGSLGHLVLLAWLLVMVLAMPAERLAFSAGLCLAVVLLVYPAAFRRLLQWRVLALLGMILLASLLIPSTGTAAVGEGVPFLPVGLVTGLQMVLRAVILLLAFDGFSSAVQVSEVAGLVERLGMRGLGFSIGIAFNLLPLLRDSAAHTWHSLWMRGGLRRKPLRGLRSLLITILGNALRRGDEIALAAEARAFTPQRSRAIPLRRGRLDAWLLIPLAGIFLAILLLPLPVWRL